LKSFITDFKDKVGELNKTNLVKNYFECLCSHCEDMEVNIESILDNISTTANKFNEELKGFILYHKVHNHYNTLLDDLFYNWIDIFEFMRNNIKTNTSNCKKTKLDAVPSYCGGSLFPDSHITTLNGANIYNPGNLVVSQLKQNVENNNPSIRMYGNITGDRRAHF